MPDAMVIPDSTAAPGGGPALGFACSCTDCCGDVARVRVAGELDIATASQLERTLREPRLQTRLVVLDLRELEFMDTCGVHAIVDASIRARRDGRRLVLLPAPLSVHRMFALTRSSDDVEIGALDLVEPAAEMLRHSDEDELAS